MRRWKTQYKLLKTKHEEYTQSQKNRKDEMNIYYKGYMDYKQKYETIDKKHKELK